MCPFPCWSDSSLVGVRPTLTYSGMETIASLAPLPLSRPPAILAGPYRPGLGCPQPPALSVASIVPLAPLGAEPLCLRTLQAAREVLLGTFSTVSILSRSLLAQNSSGLPQRGVFTPAQVLSCLVLPSRKAFSDQARASGGLVPCQAPCLPIWQSQELCPSSLLL